MSLYRTEGIWLEVIQSLDTPGEVRSELIVMEVLTTFQKPPASLMQVALEVFGQIGEEVNAAAITQAGMEVLHDYQAPINAVITQATMEVLHQHESVRVTGAAIEVFAKLRGAKFATKPVVIIMS